jgi:NCS1 family nucleobase:cation symporter-1
MAQFTASASYNITYAPYVSDYSRYLPRHTRPTYIIAAVFFEASDSAVWLIALGAWLATRLDATDALVSPRDAVFRGLGVVLALSSVTPPVATMGTNAYGAMLMTVTAVDAFQKVTPTGRLRVITITALAVLWVVVSLSISAKAVDVLFAALIMMLYLLAPWTAINLIDYFFVRHGHYAIMDLFVPDGLYGTWRGITAFLLGLAASIPFWVLPGIWTAPPRQRSPGNRCGLAGRPHRLGNHILRPEPLHKRRRRNGRGTGQRTRVRRQVVRRPSSPRVLVDTHTVRLYY